MPRRASKPTRNGANSSAGTESLRLAIKGQIQSRLTLFLLIDEFII